MFTGIVQELGVVKSLARRGTHSRLTVKSDLVRSSAAPGDSVAVNGACLTVVGLGQKELGMDVMPETFRRTNLHLLQPGHKVNLEGALRVGDLLGGHWVQGHVDGVARVTEIVREENAVVFTLAAADDLMKFVVPQGSVALDGVSLTVVNCSESSFTVSIIPHTLKETTFGFRKLGDEINLEVDLFAKYVYNHVSKLRTESKEITMEFLEEAGF